MNANSTDRCPSELPDSKSPLPKLRDRINHAFPGLLLLFAIAFQLHDATANNPEKAMEIGGAATAENFRTLPARINARGDLGIAYTIAALQPVNRSHPDAASESGADALVAGAYHCDNSSLVTGTSTLDGGKNPDAVWIFHIGPELMAADAAGTPENAINGASGGPNSFGQAATGSYPGFVGSFLGLNDITLLSGALNDVTTGLGGKHSIRVVPDSGSTILLLSGAMVLLLGFKPRSLSLS